MKQPFFLKKYFFIFLVIIFSSGNSKQQLSISQCLDQKQDIKELSNIFDNEQVNELQKQNKRIQLLKLENSELKSMMVTLAAQVKRLESLVKNEQDQ